MKGNTHINTTNLILLADAFIQVVAINGQNGSQFVYNVVDIAFRKCTNT